MNPVFRLLFMSFLVLASGAPGATTLDSLLSGMEDNASVRTQEAERERLATEHEYRTEERGWSVFGGADMGYYRELQPEGDADNYRDYGASVGLRYPLLGTLKDRDRAVTDAKMALTRQTYEIRLQRATQRFFLRQSYADWWQASAISRWCNHWRPVANKELASARERNHQQALRTSELQWLEQRWDRLIRSCERSDQYQALVRERTGRLAGMPLSESERPERPQLASGPAPLAHWTDVINHHPAVTARKRILKTAARERDDHWSDRVDSSFTIAQRLDRRMDVSGTGSGLVAGITFEVPLAALTGNAANSPDNARYRVSRERLTAELDQWRRYLEDNLLRYRDAVDDVAEAVDQLDLARRLSLEREQRLSVDTESGYMAMRTATVEEAEAHLNLYRSWRGALQEQAGLMRVADHADNPETLLGAETIAWPMDSRDSTSTDEPLRAAYVWNSHPLLDDHERRQRHLKALANAGFNHIYLGLDSGQVAQPENLQTPVEALVREAGDLGIRIDLLLGDPLWLTNEHRGDLTRLIRRLSPLPFDGLHLDLEVEQLGWPVPEQRLEQWLRTVGVAAEASPWPVSLVSHHRWFSDTADSTTCIPCQLREKGVQKVSLMIYTTRVERSGELMERANLLWPRLSFRLTQSVEAALPDSQSWHGRTPGELAGVEQALGGEGIRNIEWQDWRNHPAYPEQPDD